MKQYIRELKEIGNRTSNKQLIGLTKIGVKVPEKYAESIAEPVLFIAKILDYYNRGDPRRLLSEVNDICETITPILYELVVGGSATQGHWNKVSGIFQKLKGRDDLAAGSARVAASALQALYNVRSFKGAHKPKVQPDEFDAKFCTLGALYAFREYLSFLLYARHALENDSKINDLQVLIKEIANRLVQVPARPPSLAWLIQEYNIKTYSDKYLLIVWHLFEYGGLKEVNIRDIKTVYKRKIKDAGPKNPDDILNSLISRGFMEEVGTKGGVRSFTITHEGKEKAESLLKKSH
jgi:hypothetical protein